MKISFEKYPVDIILCIVWSLILLIPLLLDSERIIRIIVGLVFILFIPGYVLLFSLYPTKKTEKGIDLIERIALSFGLSIAIIPLISLCLNYTPWGIRLEPLFLFLSLFVFGVGAIAVIRWFKTSPDERLIWSIQISLPKSDKRLDQGLIVLVVISMFLMASTVLYVVITPKTGEHFTEFYLLDTNRKVEIYKKNLTIGDNITGIIGILNHEYRTINYTIEVWLLNQTTIYNESINKNQTTYKNMWFIDKLTVNLTHMDIDVETPWISQWESNYSFPLTRTGFFKLTFLLFINPTETYLYNEDYNDIANQKINSSYRELHLWINVN